MMRTDGDSGFTLMETLTAMMILTISLVTIFQLFSGGLNVASRSADISRAVFHAREKMDELLLYDRFYDMALEGSFGDGFRWEALVAPVASSPEDRFAVFLPSLFHLKVSVFWEDGGGERRFELETLHIAHRMEAPKRAGT